MTSKQIEEFQNEIQFIIVNRLINFEIKNIVKEANPQLYNEMYPPKPLKQAINYVMYSYDQSQNLKPIIYYKGTEFENYPKILSLVKLKVAEYQKELEDIWLQYNN